MRGPRTQDGTARERRRWPLVAAGLVAGALAGPPVFAVAQTAIQDVRVVNTATEPARVSEQRLASNAQSRPLHTRDVKLAANSATNPLHVRQSDPTGHFFVTEPLGIPAGEAAAIANIDLPTGKALVVEHASCGDFGGTGTLKEARLGYAGNGQPVVWLPAIGGVASGPASVRIENSITIWAARTKAETGGAYLMCSVNGRLVPAA